VTLLRKPDVLIVGGGVIGCAVARELATPGRTVLLVDRGAFGGGATCAAAGVLAVASGEDEGERLALRRASLARWPALAEGVHDEVGIDVRLECAGVLELSFDAPDSARARLVGRRGEGFAAEWLDGSAVRAAAPAVNPGALGGIFFAGDARVSPAHVVEALCTSARRRGAILLAGAELQALECRAGRVSRARVLGDWLEPGVVVVSAGAWSGTLAGLALPRDVVPARGQMLALRAPRAACGPTLSHAGGYLVPQPSGEVLVGSTVEHAGFACTVTPAGVSQLLEHVCRIAPAALDWPITRLWAGLRPDVPAGGPLIGRHPALANVIMATGHHRNGILLAPVTADTVTALVDGAPAPAEAAPFGAP